VRAAIDYDASAYEAINLGESRTVELRELIALLEKELGHLKMLQEAIFPDLVLVAVADEDGWSVGCDHNNQAT
jgi:hypothetical protein